MMSGGGECLCIYVSPEQCNSTNATEIGPMGAGGAIQWTLQESKGFFINTFL